MKKEINRVGVVSVFKICLLLGLVFGFIGGAIYGVIIAVMGAGILGFGGEDAAMGGVMMIVIAVIAVIVITLVYGIMYGILGAIGAAIYNIAAKSVGGVEIELEDKI